MQTHCIKSLKQTLFFIVLIMAERSDCGNDTVEGKTSVEEEKSDADKPRSREELLRSEIGDFGWFQMRYVLLVTVPILLSGVRNDYVLSAAAIPHRCQIPECGENSKIGTFKPEWILNAVPESKTGLSSCDRYVSSGAGLNGSLDYCPAGLFDRDKIVGCETFVYANNYTVVYDFDLGCQEWLRAMAGTVGNVGLLLGLPLSGYISDHFGRKVALVFNIVSMGLVGVIRAFSVNYAMYVILQCAQTVFGASVYTVAIVLATELIGPKYRFAGTILMSTYSLGQVMVGGVYWLIGYWRYATLAMCVPCLFMIVYYWLLSESIRWLLVKEKYEEAAKIIEKAARMNKRPITDKSLEALLNPPKAPVTHSGVSKAGLIGKVIHSPILLKRVCTTSVWWVSGTFIYYGLSINSTGLSDTMHLNYMLTCAVEIPGTLIGLFLMQRIGRKASLASGFFFSALCNILFIIIPVGSMSTVRLVTYLLGKVGISIATTTMFLYASELYPTECRHTLVAFSSTVGRLGTIIAPLTPVFKQYWHGLPSVLFGATGFLAGVLVFTQPETIATKLPDTFAEAELLGRSHEKLTLEPR